MPDSSATRSCRPGGAGPTRRALMVAGVSGTVAVMVAGCSNGTEPGSKPPDSPAGLAPDVAVATDALAEIRAVREAVAATVARYPATRATLGPLVALHRKHEAALVDAVPARARTSSTTAPYAVPHHRARAVSALATREQRLHDRLDQLAVRAQSGQFARLLASMGAAVHQRLAGWQT